MANQKISQLTEQTDLSLIDGLAGYEGTSNVRISGPNIISAIPTLYTNDGAINEDRVITVGYPTANPRNTYVTTFESNKTVGSQNSDKNISGTQIAIKETVNNIPSSYGTTRGAVLKLQHKNTSGSANTESYVQAFTVNSGGSDYTSRDQMGFRTNKAFVFKPTDTSWPIYFAIKGGPSNNPRAMIYSPGNGGLLQLNAGNAKTTKITIADTSSTGTSNGYYRYIEGGNNGNLVFGRKLSGGSEEPYITCSGAGGWNNDIAVGINQGTPGSTLHVTGSGSTSATNTLFVENSNGDNIFNIRDDRQVRIGAATADTETFIVNGTTRFKNQVTVDTSTSATAFRIQQGGAYTVTMGRTSGSTGFLNVNSNNFTRFTVVAGSGVAINPTGTASNAASAALTVTSTTKGILPPRMTTAQKNAIASPANGLVLFDTDLNSLQCYNGTWNSLSDVTPKTVQTLTGSSPAWTIKNGYNAKWTPPAGAVSFSITAAAGDSGSIIIDTSNSPTLTFPANSIFDDGNTQPTLSGGTDIFSFLYDGTSYYWTYGLNFTP